VKRSGKLAALCLALVLATAACGPPSALRKLVGKGTEKQTAASNDFPAPKVPKPPAQLLFGTVVLTNEPGWGDLVKRGQESGGALVLEVLPGTPAEQLGLQPGDVITWIDGAEVQNHEQLLVAFRSESSGEHEMHVKRADGTTKTITAKLAPVGDFQLLNYLQQKAAAQSPVSPVLTFLLAEQLDDQDKAIELLRGLVAEHPELAEAHALLARKLLDRLQATAGTDAITQASPDLEEVTKSIDTAVKLDPKAPSIYRDRSQIALTLGDALNAEVDATSALKMDDLSAETYYLIGTARLGQGKTAQALAPLHLAVRLDPYSIDYYASLALCYRELGQASDAEKTITAAKSLTTDTVVRQRLDDLLNRPAA
jgi:cytochrome c-type biogenesis protein CcmH/NrfG